MDIKQKAIIALVVLIASVIGYFILRRIEDKQNKQGNYSVVLHNAIIGCAALIPLSVLAIFFLAERKANEDSDELFYELKQRCKFISLTLQEGKSMTDGGIGTFNCGDKQVDVSVSGGVFKSQLREIAEKNGVPIL